MKRKLPFLIKLLRNTALISLGLLLSGCNLAILNPQGAIAQSEKKLLIFATSLMILVVIPLIIMSLVFAWRYRESNTEAVYTPDWAHSNLLEAIWWFIPCVVVTILAIFAWTSTHALDPYRPLVSKKQPLIIEAVALDWKWLFIYPKQNIATVNFIQIPINRPVRFLITADAPMNSFAIPQLAGQIYAMAGMQTKLNIIANANGVYTGLSTNYSGAGFSDMNFKVKVSSKEDFMAWVETVRGKDQHLSEAEFAALAKPSVHNSPQYFSSVKPNLFMDTIMRYMGGQMHDMGYSKAAIGEENA